MFSRGIVRVSQRLGSLVGNHNAFRSNVIPTSTTTPAVMLTVARGMFGLDMETMKKLAQMMKDPRVRVRGLCVRGLYVYLGVCVCGLFVRRNGILGGE
jgi:hypothetical protein